MLECGIRMQRKIKSVKKVKRITDLDILQQK
jgi:hypothetical protein